MDFLITEIRIALFFSNHLPFDSAIFLQAKIKVFHVSLDL